MSAIEVPLRADSTTCADAVACAHCSLPVPPRLVEPNGDSFCCAGCKTVWHALHDAGLHAYYHMVQADAHTIGATADTKVAQPARVTGRGFEHLDHPDFLARHTVVRDGVATCRLRIDGIHCGACVWLLESLPGVVPGLVASRVHLGDATIELSREAHSPLSAIARGLDRLGYQVAPMDTPAADAARRLIRRDILQLGVAGAIAVNAMGLAFALYGAHMDGMDASLRTFIQWWSVGLALLSVAWPGRVFFVSALAALRARVPHMDLPVAFGIGAAVIAALIATARGAGSIYAEGVTMLVFLLLVGRFLQRAAQRKAIDRIESASAMLPSTARRLTAAGEEDVFIDALQPGDILLVPPHESVAADGTLISGAALIDRSHLTGESMPVRCERGELVEAGSRCLDAPIRLQVIRAGEHTRAASIERLVHEAATRRAPICAKADAIAGYFLTIVIALAMACTLWWGPRIGWDAAVERAVALLVVTCPCALGLATPLAVLAGIGGAARRGVLIKGGDILERLGRPGTIILDKTGTLTCGEPRVQSATGSAVAIQLAAALERESIHPLARAVVRFADSFPSATECREATHCVEHTGEGMTGTVGGQSITVGSAQFLARSSIALDASIAGGDAGETAVHIACEGRHAATLRIGDTLRADAAPTIATLRRHGWRVLLASGDTQAAVTGVAASVGIAEHDALSALSPEDKLALVQRPDLPRPVVMVGDGINDLAALAGADCGVAVRDGAQSAARTADACIAGAGVAPLLTLTSAAHRTMRTIHLNLGISLAYNAAGAAAAFVGLVNPIVASILMPLSGLTVLGTSLLLAGPKRMH